MLTQDEIEKLLPRKELEKAIGIAERLSSEASTIDAFQDDESYNERFAEEIQAVRDHMQQVSNQLFAVAYDELIVPAVRSHPESAVAILMWVYQVKDDCLAQFCGAPTTPSGLIEGEARDILRKPPNLRIV